MSNTSTNVYLRSKESDKKITKLYIKDEIYKERTDIKFMLKNKIKTFQK